MRALSPLTDTLVGLRTDVARLASRLDEPPTPQPSSAIDAIASQIDDLKAALRSLATREEIDALGEISEALSRDLEKRPSATAVVTLSGAIATLHGQVADLSDELRQGTPRKPRNRHRRTSASKSTGWPRAASTGR